jgi:hypothetical protein
MRGTKGQIDTNLALEAQDILTLQRVNDRDAQVGSDT